MGNRTERSKSELGDIGPAHSRQCLVALAAGVANLGGLIVANVAFAGDLAKCMTRPGGCAGQALLGPLIRSASIGVLVGGVAAFFAAVSVNLVMRRRTGGIAKRVAGAIAIYLFLLLVAGSGFVFAPYGEYAVLLAFLVGPPALVHWLTSDNTDKSRFS